MKPQINSKLILVGEAIAETRQILKPLSSSYALDAQVLLAHVTGKNRAWLLAHPEAALNTGQLLSLREALYMLEKGEPLPYVLGEWYFYGHTFFVSPHVLIPRPETELLVETAIDWLERHPGQRLAVDIGTGTGCIAVALAKNVPDVHIVATDISADALAVAQANVARFKLDGQVELLNADLLAPIDGPIDLICANLPYIPTQTLHTLDVFGREPTLALDGGPDGLDLISRLLSDAPRVIAPGGLILLEIEATQTEAVENLALRHFPSASIRVDSDLAGHPRQLIINLS